MDAVEKVVPMNNSELACKDRRARVRDVHKRKEATPQKLTRSQINPEEKPQTVCSHTDRKPVQYLKDFFVAQIKVFDEASELRIEIEGRFAGATVLEVRNYWSSTLVELAPRLFIVDITQLSGYDSAGYQLLQELYAHGTRLAARTARSLAYLNEISSPGTGPALVPGSGKNKARRGKDVRSFPGKRAAGA